jgi:phosphoglucomutase
LTGGAVVTVRPSGTEPKLKIYLSVRGENRAESSAAVTRLETYFVEMIDEYKGSA